MLSPYFWCCRLLGVVDIVHSGVQFKTATASGINILLEVFSSGAGAMILGEALDLLLSSHLVTDWPLSPTPGLACPTLVRSPPSNSPAQGGFD